MLRFARPPPRAARAALVLSGGGARGAYQAGVLRGLLEIGAISAGASSFPVLVGTSAGAMNAGALAAFSDSFEDGVRLLESLWGELSPEQVFRTDLRALGFAGLRWMRDLSLGGALGRTSPKSLLDTGPLRALLTDRLPLDRIGPNIDAGRLHAIAIAATDLYTADGVVFVQGAPEAALWQRGQWSVERATIGVDHLMASSAIPIFFPSVHIDGRHFGDGSIRNTAPLSPAIQLGAERILAVGVGRRHAPLRPPVPERRAPTVAQVAATLLDAVMLDAVEVDIEHSERVNAGVVRMAAGNGAGALRWIDVLWLSPSASIRALAARHIDAIPAPIRYLMRGLGEDDAVVELASYLLFDASFCRTLLDLGRRDVLVRADEILAFFAPRAGHRARGTGA